MKNYKFWLIIVLVLLVVNSIALAVMWYHYEHLTATPVLEDGRQRPMEAKDILINTLKLDAKQQDIYGKMVESHQHITRKLTEEGRALHDSLFSNIKRPVIDTVLVNLLSKKISDNQVQLEKATLYHFRSFRAILMPEQQSKFDGIINDVLHMMSRPGPISSRQEHGGNENGMLTDSGKRVNAGRPHGMPPRGEKRGDHFGPPPKGMPPPDGDRRHHGPPPDGMPPDGPPPNGPPPDGHPPQ